jgi:uncharacterized membrane protein
MAQSIADRLEDAAAILTLGLGVIALVLGVDYWWLVFVVGWLLVVPLIDVLSGTDDEVDWEQWAARGADDEGATVADREDALDLLRERYARGELDDEAFERKVERLLATESLDDAETLLADAREARDERANADREPATERE